MTDQVIHEAHGDYTISQHPVHGMYLVSYFDKDLKRWLGLSTCNTPIECFQVIKRTEERLHS